jgi:hypothetical protein
MPEYLMKTHPPLMIKPVRSDKDPRIKDATLMFFPLHIESLISNPQQKVYNFANNGFNPTHLTCIIGIDASLIKNIAIKAREHPLFTGLKSFTFLNPTSLDEDEER